MKGLAMRTDGNISFSPKLIFNNDLNHYSQIV